MKETKFYLDNMYNGFVNLLRYNEQQNKHIISNLIMSHERFDRDEVSEYKCYNSEFVNCIFEKPFAKYVRCKFINCHFTYLGYDDSDECINKFAECEFENCSGIGSVIIKGDPVIEQTGNTGFTFNIFNVVKSKSEDYFDMMVCPPINYKTPHDALQISGCMPLGILRVTVNKTTNKMNIRKLGKFTFENIEYDRLQFITIRDRRFKLLVSYDSLSFSRHIALDVLGTNIVVLNYAHKLIVNFVNNYKGKDYCVDCEIDYSTNTPRYGTSKFVEITHDDELVMNWGEKEISYLKASYMFHKGNLELLNYKGLPNKTKHQCISYIMTKRNEWDELLSNFTREENDRISIKKDGYISTNYNYGYDSKLNRRERFSTIETAYLLNMSERDVMMLMNM